VVAGYDGLSVELEERQFHGGRAGGDDDVLRREDLLAAVGGANRDAVGREEGGGSGDDRYLTSLGELGDAGHELGDDVILAAQERGEVELDRAELDAVFGGVVLCPHEVLAGVQQGLAGDAADVEAGAAERGTLVDQSDLQAELRRAERAHVAARAGADDNEVVGREAGGRHGMKREGAEWAKVREGRS